MKKSQRVFVGRDKIVGEKESILIVEDDESLSRMLFEIIRNEGYQAEIAETGREAIEKAQKAPFNLALIDIKLPDMEGTELLALLKTMHPDLIEIVVTGYPTVENAVRALNEGASAYIIKPVRAEELLYVIKDKLKVQSLIEEKRRIEEELKNSERHLREAQAIAHIGIWEWNVGEDDIYWSDETYKIFGLNPGEFKVKYEDFLKFVHPDDVEFVKKSVDEALCEKKSYSIDHRIILPDGSIRFVHEEGKVFFDDSGNPVRMAGTVLDITKYKQLENELKKRERYLRLQIERMPIGLITWDTNLHVKSWNPAAEKIFGYSAEEALGKHAYELIIPKKVQSTTDEVWRRLIKGDETAHSINENITKDGRIIVCRWTNTPLKDENGMVVGVLSMVQDITEHKKAETKIRELTYRINGVAPGECYLSESHERCLKIFTDLFMHGVRGLCIIRENPDLLVKNYGIPPEIIRLIASRPVSGFQALTNLQEVSISISEFLRSGGGVVLLDGLEYLINRFDFDSVYSLLQEKRFDFLDARGVLLIPLNLKTISNRERALLESELKTLK